MLKKITLKIAYNKRDYVTDETEVIVKELRVWAWVDGAFAIHKGIAWESNEKQSPHHWVLTHIPTSGICKTSLIKQDVVDEMHKLKSWKFGGKTLEEVKACDFIEFAPIIYEKNVGKPASRTVSEYEKTAKPFFEAAVGC